MYFIDSQSIWSLSLRQTGSSTIPFSRLVIGSDPNYLSNPKSLNTTTSGTSIPKTTPSSSTPPCDRSVPGNQMLLNNPEHLAFSTLEQTLYFSDNDHVSFYNYEKNHFA